jgi:predicted hotdog family 3-hydroxylacyl-ACP dehydratase
MINIEELIPQRVPFIMVDALTHFDEVMTQTRLLVKEENIFVENSRLTASGIIENIAQTCAARMGYVNKYLHSEGIKIGFIGSVKNLVIEEFPNAGEELMTTIEVVSEVFSITLVNAKTVASGRLIASCEMKISITDMDSNDQ